MHAGARTSAGSSWRSRLTTLKPFLLLLYGVAACAFAVNHFDSTLPNDMRLMETRIKGVSDSIAVLDQGGPPLLGCEGQYNGESTDLRERCFGTGESDDQGLYLYLPALANLFGETEPALMVKWLFIWLIALVVLVYPLVFATLFRSTLAGVLAPWPVIFSFDFLQNIDIYWISGWALLFCLPLVLLAAGREWWDRRSLGLLVAAAAFAGFASSIRSHAGLPIVLAAAIVVLLRRRSWRSRVLAVGAVAVAYVLCSSFVLAGARAYRDRVTGVDFGAAARTTHPLWHPTYLGLGYLPNDYGITWNDTVALDAAKRERPGVVYLSPEYEQTLRKLYFEIVRDDPGFVATTYWAKFRGLLHQARGQFGLLLLLIPAMLFLGPHRHRHRLYAALTVPALALTLAPPILTRPDLEYGYNVGWLAAVGLLCLLAAFWAIVAAERLAVRVVAGRQGGLDWAEARASVRDRLAFRQQGALRWKRIAGVVAAALVGVVSLELTSGYEPPQRQIDYASFASPLRPNGGLRGTEVISWDFGSGVPAGWKVSENVVTAGVAQGTDVVTNAGPSDYQLVSREVKLPAGEYRVDLRGAVLAGGLELGALDAEAETWLSQSRYWWGQRGFEASSMPLELSLESARTVRFVLANWSAGSESHWTVEELRLVSL